ncbi:HD domain-containing protein [Corynebacterium guangdongense]|uniref:HD superfamily phosphodiesterase n=1 Tax=Corynebacterium guangdongense TaxID=1783348 RepID=A0ABU1ZYR1_9CORY|nr:HD domain-containing protein [Corynebacterium guangdongense]MDR7330074.1 HD superfamily phosphodiesterase [Corynebacterium guangdongense]WJZ18632.1 HD domain protein [Corynebacterium guangdongense]
MTNNPPAPAWAPAPTAEEQRADPRAIGFAQRYPARPIPTEHEVDTGPICLTPASGLDELWRSIVPETRTRANDLHLPMVVAYAERLCAAYPQADRELVLVAVALHDTGWAHVDESRIISEGFSGDWRKANIRYEHEAEGVNVARRVLPGLGYDEEFVEKVCEIIDGHDTRPVAYSLEDALVRDCDRLWRFDRAGIAMSTSWFGMPASDYVDRLAREIIPELITDAAHRIAEADLERSRRLFRTEVIR